MRVARVIIEGAARGKVLDLSGEAYHHLARVLRRSKGDPLIALDGRGGVFQAVVEDHDPSRGSMKVAVGEPLAAALAGGASLALAVGIPRGDGFEVALRWASEMGVARLVPLLTARGTVKAPRGEVAREGKIERWRRIARESAEQCGRPVPLAVDAPISLEKVLERAEEHPSRWIAVPGAGGQSVLGLLESLSAGGGEVLVLVGPEGGFSPVEAGRAVSRGFQVVGFPTPVLRTPTAVVYLGALASLAVWL